MLLNCLFVGCGGFIGSVLRYLMSFLEIGTHNLPFATLGINVLGSFAIMFFSGPILSALSTNDHLALFMRVGLCGGFTTFSTFSAETLVMFESGNYALGFIYVFTSVAFCIGAAILGKIASSALTLS